MNPMASNFIRNSTLLLLFLHATGVTAGTMNETSASYYELGQNWQRKGNFKEALNAISKAVSISPDDSELRASYAFVLLRNGNKEQALTQYAKAVELETNNPKLRLLYGKCLYSVGRYKEATEQLKIASSLDAKYPLLYLSLAEAQQASGEFNESIDPLNKVLTEDPNNVNALSLLATANHKANNFPTAIEIYKKILALEPSNEWAELNLARSYYQSGSFDEAETAYLKILEVRPNSVDSLTALADISYRKKRLEAAIQYAQRALALQPSDPSINAMLASYFEKTDNYSQALTHYKQAFINEKTPELQSKYLMAQSQIYFKQGDFEDAEIVVKQLLEKDPENLDLKVQMADIRLWQKAYGQAAATYKEALTVKSSLIKSKGFLFNYGAALNGLKEWPAAEIIWSNYLKLERNSKEAWLNYATCLDEQNKTNEAIAAYRKTISLGYNKVQSLEDISRLQIKAQQYQDAVETLQQLIDLNPNNEKYKQEISHLLVKLNKPEDAVKLLQQNGQSVVPARLSHADKLVRAGNYHNAAIEYQKVLLEAPNNTEALLGLAESYSAIGNFNEAVDLYKRYLTSEPNDFHAQFNYASSLANIGKQKESISEYKKAIELNPHYADSYYALGMIYIDSNVYEARRNWKKYLDLSPNGQYKSEIVHYFPDLH
jgi:tetratricopeptide (TPR) repeat protein